MDNVPWTEILNWLESKIPCTVPGILVSLSEGLKGFFF